MAILNFPNTGLVANVTQYTGDNGTTYTWDGVKWVGRAAGGAAGTNSLQNGSYTVQVDVDGDLVLPVGSVIKDSAGNPVGGGGISISDFGEGFGLDNDDKIVTNKLYSTNLTNSAQHYRLELDTNGVVHLPDQSIINGATLKSVPGNFAGITAGPVGHDEDSWVWVDSEGAWIATDYSGNANTWKFKNDGDLELPKNKHITLPVSTDEDRYGGDISISGQRGYGGWSTTGGAGWGSSIYVSAGDGGESNTNDAGGEGGEIWLRSGNGQAGNNGGKVSLIAGNASFNNSSNPVYGGEARVRAGDAIDGTSGLGQGGNVNITAGQGDQANGVVNITTQNSDNTDNIWTFAGSVLNLPSTSDIKRGGISVLQSELEIDGGNANTPELGELIIDGNNGA